MADTDGIEKLFLRKKPARLLVHIKQAEKPYASTLAKKIDCTYSHTVKLLQKMQEFGLVDFNKDGRTKFVELTASGNELAGKFEGLIFRTIRNHER